MPSIPLTGRYRRVISQLLIFICLPGLAFFLFSLHHAVDLSSITTADVYEWKDRIVQAHALGCPEVPAEEQQAACPVCPDVASTPSPPPPTIPIAGTRRSCSMCDVYQEFCDEEGEDKLLRAVTYSGTNKRLRKVLRKMRTGEPWVMGVLGGSVSTGQGMSYSYPSINPPWHPRYRRPNMHRVLFDHLDERFPSKNPVVADALKLAEERITPKQIKGNSTLLDVAALVGSLGTDVANISDPISRAYGFSGRSLGVNSFINGAQGATGSEYWSSCFLEHIPEDVDLVVLETAINDDLTDENMTQYEWLLRAIMELPNSPAIIVMEAMALATDTMIRGGDLHKGINEYYDLPSISVRNAFILDTQTDTINVTAQYFVKNAKEPLTIDEMDLGHISPLLHGKAGQLLSAYIDSQICAMEVEEEKEGWEKRYEGVEILPRIRLNDRFDLSTTLEPFHPTCFSATSNKHKLTSLSNKGWSEWAWQEKKYWVANETGSTVSFALPVVFGVVNVMYQRSGEYGLGDAACWIEGEHEADTRRVIKGYWTHPWNTLQTTTWYDVGEGDQVLTCELLGTTDDPGGGVEFRLASISA